MHLYDPVTVLKVTDFSSYNVGLRGRIRPWGHWGGRGGGTKRVSSGVLGNAQRIVSQTLLLNYYYWAWWKCRQLWSWWPKEKEGSSKWKLQKTKFERQFIEKMCFRKYKMKKNRSSRKNNRAMVGLKRQSWQRYKELNALRELYQEVQNCNRICHDLYTTKYKQG